MALNGAYPIEVHILDRQSSQRVVYQADGYDEPDQPGTFSSFIWQEGNFSCDCNRAIFFSEAGGQGVDEDKQPCGKDRFLLEKITRKSDGQVLYEEHQRPVNAPR